MNNSVNNKEINNEEDINEDELSEDDKNKNNELFDKEYYNTEKKCYICNDCFTEFTRKYNLIKHLNNKKYSFNKSEYRRLCFCKNALS